MQYVRRTYSTPAAIRSPTTEFRNILQTPDEDELAYGARIKNAAYFCGNVHEEDEKMTFFIDRLRPEIMTIVARFREN